MGYVPLLRHAGDHVARIRGSHRGGGARAHTCAACRASGHPHSGFGVPYRGSAPGRFVPRLLAHRPSLRDRAAALARRPRAHARRTLPATLNGRLNRRATPSSTRPWRVAESPGVPGMSLTAHFELHTPNVGRIPVRLRPLSKSDRARAALAPASPATTHIVSRVKVASRPAEVATGQAVASRMYDTGLGVPTGCG